MKSNKLIKLSISLVIILNFVFPMKNPGQQKSQDNIQVTLNTLFKLSKAKDFNSAAEYIVYVGNDAERNYRTTYDKKNRFEFNQVKRICNKIYALTDLSDSYEIDNPVKETKDNKIFYKIKVLFISDKQKITSEFIFVKVNDKYMLTDIN